MSRTLSMLFGLLILVGCGGDTPESGAEESQDASVPAESGDLVEAGVEEILSMGEEYVDLLGSISNADDAREEWESLQSFEKGLSALSEKYGTVQAEITAVLDSSERSTALNARLHSEMTRLMADPEIAQMFTQLNELEQSEGSTTQE